MKSFLSKNVEVSGLVEETLFRLQAEYPESVWSFTGDHCLHQGELFLHFADSAERRMWWVRVDSEASGVAMSWNMDGMSDLV